MGEDPAVLGAVRAEGKTGVLGWRGFVVQVGERGTYLNARAIGDSATLCTSVVVRSRLFPAAWQRRSYRRDLK